MHSLAVPNSLDSTIFCLLDQNGDTSEPASLPVLETRLRMFREMLRIRILDEKFCKLQRQGRVAFYGACTGQEAVPVGVGLGLELSDWVFPALREGGLMLVRGFDLRTYIAQAWGNSRDLNKGRQMPSHMSGRSVLQASWSSCVGTQLPHAVGAGMAMKLRGDSSISVGFVGDGGTSTADFHAAMNFASVFHVPVVIVCQNNHWAISVPSRRQTGAALLSHRALAYGMPAVRVDGNDVIAVHKVFGDAGKRARSGGGPTFIECVTYRLGPHSSSDEPGLYRSSEEEATWWEREPLSRLSKHLLRAGVLEGEIEEMRISIVNEIDSAIEFSEKLPPPSVASLIEDVYEKVPRHLIEQFALWQGPHS